MEKKKKVDSYIIPPTYYRKNEYSITNKSKVSGPLVATIVPVNNEVTPIPVAKSEITLTTNNTIGIVAPISNEPKISAFSLSSIKAIKTLEENSKSIVKETIHLATEAFTETEMLIQWTRYAKRLGDKGFKIMESILLINDPVLHDATSIHFELPNEGSKLDFESEKNGLLNYLRSHLHNHDISIEVIVNESITSIKSFNDQDRYNRLCEINPNIELLRSTFGLDLNS